MANNIENRIKRIDQFFRGMQVENIDGENVIYVIVEFPARWYIEDGIEEKYGIVVQESQDQQGFFFFIAEMGIGFEALFDAIEYNIDKMKAAQERATLLQQKILELKALFEDEDMTLENLRNLEFTWKGKKKLPAKPQLSKEKVDEKTGETEEEAGKDE